MPGGLLQLIATGIEDGPIIYNPEITFFKKVYKRHTNFSIYSNKINLGTKQFGSIIEYSLPNKGDLIGPMYLISKFKPKKLTKKITQKIVTTIQNTKITDKINKFKELNNFLNETDEGWYLIPEPQDDEHTSYNYILLNFKWLLLERYNLVEKASIMKIADNFTLIDLNKKKLSDFTNNFIDTNYIKYYDLHFDKFFSMLPLFNLLLKGTSSYLSTFIEKYNDYIFTPYLVTSNTLTLNIKQKIYDEIFFKWHLKYIYNKEDSELYNLTFENGTMNEIYKYYLLTNNIITENNNTDIEIAYQETNDLELSKNVIAEYPLIIKGLINNIYGDNIKIINNDSTESDTNKYNINDFLTFDIYRQYEYYEHYKIHNETGVMNNVINEMKPELLTSEDEKKFPYTWYNNFIKIVNNITTKSPLYDLVFKEYNKFKYTITEKFKNIDNIEQLSNVYMILFTIDKYWDKTNSQNKNNFNNIILQNFQDSWTSYHEDFINPDSETSIDHPVDLELILVYLNFLFNKLINSLYFYSTNPLYIRIIYIAINIQLYFNRQRKWINENEKPQKEESQKKTYFYYRFNNNSFFTSNDLKKLWADGTIKWHYILTISNKELQKSVLNKANNISINIQKRKYIDEWKKITNLNKKTTYKYIKNIVTEYTTKSLTLTGLIIKYNWINYPAERKFQFIINEKIEEVTILKIEQINKSSVPTSFLFTLSQNIEHYYKICDDINLIESINISLPILEFRNRTESVNNLNFLDIDNINNITSSFMNFKPFILIKTIVPMFFEIIVYDQNSLPQFHSITLDTKLHIKGPLPQPEHTEWKPDIVIEYEQYEFSIININTINEHTYQFTIKYNQSKKEFIYDDENLDKYNVLFGNDVEQYNLHQIDVLINEFDYIPTENITLYIYNSPINLLEQQNNFGNKEVIIKINDILFDETSETMEEVNDYGIYNEKMSAFDINDTKLKKQNIINFFNNNFGFKVDFDKKINNYIKTLLKNSIYIYLENYEKELFFYTIINNINSVVDLYYNMWQNIFSKLNNNSIGNTSKIIYEKIKSLNSMNFILEFIKYHNIDYKNNSLLYITNDEIKQLLQYENTANKNIELYELFAIPNGWNNYNYKNKITQNIDLYLEKLAYYQKNHINYLLDNISIVEISEIYLGNNYFADTIISIKNGYENAVSEYTNDYYIDLAIDNTINSLPITLSYYLKKSKTNDLHIYYNKQKIILNNYYDNILNVSMDKKIKNVYNLNSFSRKQYQTNSKYFYYYDNIIFDDTDSVITLSNHEALQLNIDFVIWSPYYFGKVINNLSDNQIQVSNINSEYQDKLKDYIWVSDDLSKLYIDTINESYYNVTTSSDDEENNIYTLKFDKIFETYLGDLFVANIWELQLNSPPTYAIGSTINITKDNMDFKAIIYSIDNQSIEILLNDNLDLDLSYTFPDNIINPIINRNNIYGVVSDIINIFTYDIILPTIHSVNEGDTIYFYSLNNMTIEETIDSCEMSNSYIETQIIKTYIANEKTIITIQFDNYIELNNSYKLSLDGTNCIYTFKILLVNKNTNIKIYCNESLNTDFIENNLAFKNYIYNKNNIFKGWNIKTDKNFINYENKTIWKKVDVVETIKAGDWILYKEQLLQATNDESEQFILDKISLNKYNWKLYLKESIEPTNQFTITVDDVDITATITYINIMVKPYYIIVTIDSNINLNNIDTNYNDYSSSIIYQSLIINNLFKLKNSKYKLPNCKITIDTQVKLKFNIYPSPFNINDNIIARDNENTILLKITNIINNMLYVTHNANITNKMEFELVINPWKKVDNAKININNSNIVNQQDINYGDWVIIENNQHPELIKIDSDDNMCIANSNSLSDGDYSFYHLQSSNLFHSFNWVQLDGYLIPIVNGIRLTLQIHFESNVVYITGDGLDLLKNNYKIIFIYNNTIYPYNKTYYAYDLYVYNDTSLGVQIYEEDIDNLNLNTILTNNIDFVYKPNYINYNALYENNRIKLMNYDLNFRNNLDNLYPNYWIKINNTIKKIKNISCVDNIYEIELFNTDDIVPDSITSGNNVNIQIEKLEKNTTIYNNDFLNNMHERTETESFLYANTDYLQGNHNMIHIKLTELKDRIYFDKSLSTLDNKFYINKINLDNKLEINEDDLVMIKNCNDSKYACILHFITPDVFTELNLKKVDDNTNNSWKIYVLEKNTNEITVLILGDFNYFDIEISENDTFQIYNNDFILNALKIEKYTMILSVLNKEYVFFKDKTMKIKFLPDNDETISLSNYYFKTTGKVQYIMDEKIIVTYEEYINLQEKTMKYKYNNIELFTFTDSIKYNNKILYPPLYIYIYDITIVDPESVSDDLLSKLTKGDEIILKNSDNKEYNNLIAFYIDHSTDTAVITIGANHKIDMTTLKTINDIDIFGTGETKVNILTSHIFTWYIEIAYIQLFNAISEEEKLVIIHNNKNIINSTVLEKNEEEYKLTIKINTIFDLTDDSVIYGYHLSDVSNINEKIVHITVTSDHITYIQEKDIIIAITLDNKSYELGQITNISENNENYDITIEFNTIIKPDCTFYYKFNSWNNKCYTNNNLYYKIKKDNDKYYIEINRNDIIKCGENYQYYLLKYPVQTEFITNKTNIVSILQLNGGYYFKYNNDIFVKILRKETTDDSGNIIRPAVFNFILHDIFSHYVTYLDNFYKINLNYLNISDNIKNKINWILDDYSTNNKYFKINILLNDSFSIEENEYDTTNFSIDENEYDTTNLIQLYKKQLKICDIKLENNKNIIHFILLDYDSTYKLHCKPLYDYDYSTSKYKYMYIDRSIPISINKNNTVFLGNKLILQNIEIYKSTNTFLEVVEKINFITKGLQIKNNNLWEQEIEFNNNNNILEVPYILGEVTINNILVNLIVDNNKYIIQSTDYLEYTHLKLIKTYTINIKNIKNIINKNDKYDQITDVNLKTLVLTNNENKINNFKSFLNKNITELIFFRNKINRIYDTDLYVYTLENVVLSSIHKYYISTPYIEIKTFNETTKLSFTNTIIGTGETDIELNEKIWDKLNDIKNNNINIWKSINIELNPTILYRDSYNKYGYENVLSIAEKNDVLQYYFNIYKIFRDIDYLLINSKPWEKWFELAISLWHNKTSEPSDDYTIITNEEHFITNHYFLETEIINLEEILNYYREHSEEMEKRNDIILIENKIFKCLPLWLINTNAFDNLPKWIDNYAQKLSDDLNLQHTWRFKYNCWLTDTEYESILNDNIPENISKDSNTNSYNRIYYLSREYTLDMNNLKIGRRIRINYSEDEIKLHDVIQEHIDYIDSFKYIIEYKNVNNDLFNLLNAVGKNNLLWNTIDLPKFILNISNLIDNYSLPTNKEIYDSKLLGYNNLPDKVYSLYIIYNQLNKTYKNIFNDNFLDNISSDISIKSNTFYKYNEINSIYMEGIVGGINHDIISLGSTFSNNTLSYILPVKSELSFDNIKYFTGNYLPIRNNKLVKILTNINTIDIIDSKLTINLNTTNNYKYSILLSKTFDYKSTTDIYIDFFDGKYIKIFPEIKGTLQLTKLKFTSKYLLPTNINTAIWVLNPINIKSLTTIGYIYKFNLTDAIENDMVSNLLKLNYISITFKTYQIVPINYQIPNYFTNTNLTEHENLLLLSHNNIDDILDTEEKNLIIKKIFTIYHVHEKIDSEDMILWKVKINPFITKLNDQAKYLFKSSSISNFYLEFIFDDNDTIQNGFIDLRLPIDINIKIGDSITEIYQIGVETVEQFEDFPYMYKVEQKDNSTSKFFQNSIDYFGINIRLTKNDTKIDTRLLEERDDAFVIITHDEIKETDSITLNFCKNLTGHIIKKITNVTSLDINKYLYIMTLSDITSKFNILPTSCYYFYNNSDGIPELNEDEDESIIIELENNEKGTYFDSNNNDYLLYFNVSFSDTHENSEGYISIINSWDFDDELTINSFIWTPPNTFIFDSDHTYYLDTISEETKITDITLLDNGKIKIMNITTIPNTLYDVYLSVINSWDLDIYSYIYEDDSNYTLIWTPPDYFIYYSNTNTSYRYYLDNINEDNKIAIGDIQLIDNKKIKISNIIDNIPKNIYYVYSESIILHEHKYFQSIIINYEGKEDFTNITTNSKIKLFTVQNTTTSITELGIYIYSCTLSVLLDQDEIQNNSAIKIIYLNNDNEKICISGTIYSISDTKLYFETTTYLLNNKSNQNITIVYGTTSYEIDNYEYITKDNIYPLFINQNNLNEVEIFVPKEWITLLSLNDTKEFHGKYIVLYDELFTINNDYVDLFNVNINQLSNKLSSIETIELTEHVKYKFVENLSERLIKSMQFYFNDQLIENINDEWLRLASYLFQKDGYSKLIEIKKNESNDTIELITPLPFWFTQNQNSYLPVLALPYTDLRIKIKTRTFAELIIGASEILENIDIEHNLLIDYIFLGETERKIFAESKHEYLIKVVNSNDVKVLKQVDNTIPLNLNNMVIDIFWFLKPINNTKFEQYTWETEEYIYDTYYKKYISELNEYNKYISENKILYQIPISFHNIYILFKTIEQEINDYELNPDSTDTKIVFIKMIKNDKFLSLYSLNFILYLTKQYLNYLDNSDNYTNIFNTLRLYFKNIYKNNKKINKQDIMKNAKIKINGREIFSRRENIWFNVKNVLPYKKNVPQGIYVHSFDIFPLDYQPSGALNFSLTDDNVLRLKLNDNIKNSPVGFHLYYRSYNILRIMSGIGGLAWY